MPLYTNKNKVAGVNVNDPTVKEQIYERYLKAYKKGAFNYIKEDPTPDGQVVPRKYFSGGTSMAMTVLKTHDRGMLTKVLATAMGLLLLTVGCNKSNEEQKQPIQNQFSQNTLPPQVQNITVGSGKDQLMDRGLDLNVVGFWPQYSPGGGSVNYLYFQIKSDGKTPVNFTEAIAKGYADGHLITASLAKPINKTEGPIHWTKDVHYYDPDPQGNLNLPSSSNLPVYSLKEGQHFIIPLPVLADKVEIIVKRPGGDSTFTVTNPSAPFEQPDHTFIYKKPPQDPAMSKSQVKDPKENEAMTAEEAFVARMVNDLLLVQVSNHTVYSIQKNEKAFKVLEVVAEHYPGAFTDANWDLLQKQRDWLKNVVPVTNSHESDQGVSDAISIAERVISEGEYIFIKANPIFELIKNLRIAKLKKDYEEYNRISDLFHQKGRPEGNKIYKYVMLRAPDNEYDSGDYEWQLLSRAVNPAMSQPQANLTNKKDNNPAMYKKVGLTALLEPLYLNLNPNTLEASDGMDFIKRHSMFTSVMTRKDMAMMNEILEIVTNSYVASVLGGGIVGLLSRIKNQNEKAVNAGVAGIVILVPTIVVLTFWGLPTFPASGGDSVMMSFNNTVPGGSDDVNPFSWTLALIGLRGFLFSISMTYMAFITSKDNAMSLPQAKTSKKNAAMSAKFDATFDWSRKEQLPGGLLYFELNGIQDKSREAFTQLLHLTPVKDEKYILIMTHQGPVLIGRLAEVDKSLWQAMVSVTAANIFAKTLPGIQVGDQGVAPTTLQFDFLPFSGYSPDVENAVLSDFGNKFRREVKYNQMNPEETLSLEINQLNGAIHAISLGQSDDAMKSQTWKSLGSNVNAAMFKSFRERRLKRIREQIIANPEIVSRIIKHIREIDPESLKVRKSLEKAIRNEVYLSAFGRTAVWLGIDDIVFNISDAIRYIKEMGDLKARFKAGFQGKYETTPDSIVILPPDVTFTGWRYKGFPVGDGSKPQGVWIGPKGERISGTEDNPPIEAMPVYFDINGILSEYTGDELKSELTKFLIAQDQRTLNKLLLHDNPEVSFMAAEILSNRGDNNPEVLLRLSVRKNILSQPSPEEVAQLLEYEQRIYKLAREGKDFTSKLTPWEESQNPHLKGVKVRSFSIRPGAPQKLSNQAMANGGIDLNQINVLRGGKTVNVQFDLAQLNALEQGGFDGFSPVIINIQHISSPFQLLGLKTLHD